MQRLITIELYNANDHGCVEEYLREDLAQGWSIVSVTAIGAGVGNSSAGAGERERTRNIEGYVAGWIAVVLEK